jgi:rSAM/selenodomain-associated transferase 1
MVEPHASAPHAAVPRPTTTIFTRRPAAGSVKTRLEPRIGPARAADLALAMLDDTVEKCVAEPAFETVLCVTPADAIDWFRSRYARVARVLSQRGEGLGARLAQHARTELESGGRTLVIVGSDAPHAPVSAIVAAHAELARGTDLVLGLDDGGGYWLVGLREPHVELFTRVPMSTRDMGAETVTLARSLGLSVAFVDPCFDVDEPRDLDRLIAGIASGAIDRLLVPRTAARLDAFADVDDPRHAG